MNRQELLEFHKKITEEARATMVRKNADYAEADDPFQNLRLVENMGLASAERGILIRLADKMQRLSNLLDRDAAVTDESFTDTVEDGINYLILLLAMYQIRKGKSNKSIPLGMNKLNLPHMSQDEMEILKKDLKKLKDSKDWARIADTGDWFRDDGSDLLEQ